MATLSDPTIGLLTQIAVDVLSGDELETLLLRADLQKDEYRGFDRGGTSKHGRVRPWLRGARAHADEGDIDAHRSLLSFARLLVERTVRDPDQPPAWFGDLREALLADGYELAWDRQEEPMPNYFGLSSGRITVTYRMLPTDTGPIPLADEVSALERELILLGYVDALNHYRQAVRNLAEHQYEAANGQTRTMLEALAIGLAKDKTKDYVSTGQQGEGSRAIRHIVDSAKALPERDGGKMLLGLWSMIQTNGPHPGKSTADEARTRLQLVTATARFLLNHFPR